MIDRLRQQGASIILCSHVLAGVEAHINRAAILANGCLQAIGSLSRLREDADLPARIRASGLCRREQWLQRWNAAGHTATAVGGNGIEVMAVNGHKVDLLRQLFHEDQPQDIEILQPSLEDLYGYYMSRATTGTEGTQP